MDLRAASSSPLPRSPSSRPTRGRPAADRRPARAGCRGPHPRRRTCLFREPRGYCVRRARRSAARASVAVTVDAGVNSPTYQGFNASPTSPNPQNLTAAGTTDWRIWGRGLLSTLGDDDHRSGGTGISALTDIDPQGQLLRGLGAIGLGVGYGPSTVPFSFSWTNGSNALSATAIEAGLQHNNILSATTPGAGFSFSVPATADAQDLTIWVSAHHGTGRLTATLGGVSQTDNHISGGQNHGGIYHIHFNGTGAVGETLQVSWVLDTVVTPSSTLDFRRPAQHRSQCCPVRGGPQVTRSPGRGCADPDPCRDRGKRRDPRSPADGTPRSRFPERDLLLRHFVRSRRDYADQPHRRRAGWLSTRRRSRAVRARPHEHAHGRIRDRDGLRRSTHRRPHTRNASRSSPNNDSWPNALDIGGTNGNVGNPALGAIRSTSPANRAGTSSRSPPGRR